VKDNISLIAAAAGGFMVSVALSGMLRGEPVVSWHGKSSISSYSVTHISARVDSKNRF
jgi:hypothetical protein